jgi:hypothetical protein
MLYLFILDIFHWEKWSHQRWVNTKTCYKICCRQFHCVILVLSYISETYLRELSLTHTISEKNDPFWLILGDFIEVNQLLPHNSLQILNYLNSGRLQSNLNVVPECLWIMTCTHLYQLKQKKQYVCICIIYLKQAEFCITQMSKKMPNILFTVTCFLH